MVSSAGSGGWSRPWNRFHVSAADYDPRVIPSISSPERSLRARSWPSLLDRAAELKADRLASRALERRSVALVFERPSTRTRVSFEVGVAELGGHPLVLREGELQLSRGESVRDTALVLSRFVHAICVRTGPHETLEELAEHGSVPVINMLTARPPPVPGAGRPADAARALRRRSTG